MSKNPSEEISPDLISITVDAATGQYLATIPGFESAKGRGSSWGEAVADLHAAVKTSVSKDPSVAGNVANLSGFSGRFSVRVPRSVHRALHVKATGENVSLNAYVSSILAERVGRDPLAGSGKAGVEEIPEDTLIQMAESENADSIGTSTRIAYDVFHRISPSIGLAIAVLLGDRIAALEDPGRVTEHYGRFAWRAYKAGYTALSLVLWRRGLKSQPDNVKTASSYGQVLYKLGRYQEALDPLSKAADRDGRLTFLKARLQLSASGIEGQNVDEAVGKITEMMKEWAFRNASAEEASQWRAHLVDLERISLPELRGPLEQLRGFAGTYSRWS